MTSVRNLRGGYAALVGVLLTAACRVGPVVLGQPSPLDCRGVITPFGAESAAAVTWSAPLGGGQPDRLDRVCRTVGPAVVRMQPAAVSVGRLRQGFGEPRRSCCAAESGEPRPPTLFELRRGLAEALAKAGRIATREGGAQAAAAHRLDEEPLAIVSWNAHVDGGDVGRFVADLRAGRFSGGRRIEHFVLLLQETFRRAGDVPGTLARGVRVPGRIAAPRRTDEDPDLVEVARALGVALCYVPSMRNGPPIITAPGEDRGNAILSTLPLAGLRAVELPFERQRRVAVAATITLDWKGAPLPLVVASAHLDSVGSWRRLWFFAAPLRTRQARAIVAATAHDSVAVIGADLNTWSGPDERAYKELRQAYPDTPQPDPRPTFAHAGLRVDYLFFRLPDGLEADYERLDDRYGSDHYPLLAWLRASTSRSWGPPLGGP